MSWTCKKKLESRDNSYKGTIYTNHVTGKRIETIVITPIKEQYTPLGHTPHDLNANVITPIKEQYTLDIANLHCLQNT